MKHARSGRCASALVVLAVLLAPAHARADTPDPDPWLGPDKALHFSLSAGLAGAGYLAATAFDAPRWGRLATGGAFSLTLGAAKELWDLAGHGDPSWRDFTWDAIGTVAGLVIAWGIDLAVGGVDARHTLFGPMPGGAPPAAAGVRGLHVSF